jgi:hypothetical protein
MDPLILGSQALRAGRLTEYQLRTRYRMVYRNVYLAKGVAMTAELKARAGWLFAGPDAVLAGVSAAAVHGTKWLDADAPAVVVRPDRHRPKGLAAYSYALAPQDICLRQGMRVTTAARTAFDLARLLPHPRAVPLVDALMNATDLKVIDVESLIEANPGVRGVRQTQSALALVDGGAESPQESRLRLALVAGGLPAPETQIRFYDEYGEAFIRADMGWRQWKVAVEYDGVRHWNDGRQRAWDIERIAILEAMGWVVVRVSAAMLRDPEKLVARVRAKLRAAGCPV